MLSVIKKELSNSFTLIKNTLSLIYISVNYDFILTFNSKKRQF